MGCSTSQGAKVLSAETKENGINEKAEGDRKYPPGEAFEVSLEDESDSIIKKHPPKRLQRLVDAPTTQTTIEELEEKLANAEIRRNQFLTERINTLKAKDDESIFNNGDEKSNGIENNEMHTETSTVDTDEPKDSHLDGSNATEAEAANDTTNKTQENE